MKLLEREPELAAMTHRWRRARERAGSFVLVGGESGIGKTQLVRTFADEAAADGRVAWGACDPLQTPRPLGPLHDAAEDLGGEPAALLAGPAAFAHEVARALFDALAATPTVLVVEDAHWVDDGTLDVLRHVLRRIAATHSLVVVTYRDDELGHTHPLRGLLGDAARTPDVTWVTPRPLSVGATAALAAGHGLDPGTLHARTGGNPFFVQELLAHADDDLPATVREAVLARTSGLDDDTRDLLDLLACAPEAVPDRALPALGVGVRHLRTLDATGLVGPGRRGVAFRHELARRAVESAIPPGGAVALHARMLAALEALGTVDPATLAHHAACAGDDAAVLEHASLAGLEAGRSGAHTQAEAFFALALERGGPAPDQRAELLELQAAELYLTDRLDDAITASEQAMALREEAGDRAGVGALHEALSVYQWYNANRAVSERHASAAVGALEATDDLLRLGHAYAMEGYLAMQRSDLARARPFTRRAGQISAEVGDHLLETRVRILDAELDVMGGDPDARDEILALVERDVASFDEVHSSGYSNLAYLDVEQRRLGAAADVLARSLPMTELRDLPICQVWQTGVRGRLALIRGEWTAAVADAETVLGGGAAPLARTWPHLVRGLVRLRRGEAGAAEDLDAAWALATRFGEPLRLLPALAALAEQAWLRDAPDSAPRRRARPPGRARRRPRRRLVGRRRRGVARAPRPAGGRRRAPPGGPAPPDAGGRAARGRGRLGGARRPVRPRASAWSTRATRGRSPPRSRSSTASAPTRWPRGCAATCGRAASPTSRAAGAPPRGRTPPASRPASSRSSRCSTRA